MPMRKSSESCPLLLPKKGGCVGPALHGVLLPAWLEVSRRHGLSVGQGATDLLVVIWVSSTCVRAVMHEAGAGLALASLESTGCCICAAHLGSAGSHLIPLLKPETGSPISLANKLSPTSAGDVFLACWRQSPSYSVKSLAGQGLAVLSLHKSKHC